MCDVTFASLQFYYRLGEMNENEKKETDLFWLCEMNKSRLADRESEESQSEKNWKKVWLFVK